MAVSSVVMYCVKQIVFLSILNLLSLDFSKRPEVLVGRENRIIRKDLKRHRVQPTKDGDDMLLQYVALP